MIPISLTGIVAFTIIVIFQEFKCENENELDIWQANEVSASSDSTEISDNNGKTSTFKKPLKESKETEKARRAQELYKRSREQYEHKMADDGKCCDEMRNDTTKENIGTKSKESISRRRGINFITIRESLVNATQKRYEREGVKIKNYLKKKKATKKAYEKVNKHELAKLVKISAAKQKEQKLRMLRTRESDINDKNKRQNKKREARQDEDVDRAIESSRKVRDMPKMAKLVNKETKRVGKFRSAADVKVKALRTKHGSKNGDMTWPDAGSAAVKLRIGHKKSTRAAVEMFKDASNESDTLSFEIDEPFRNKDPKKFSPYSIKSLMVDLIEIFEKQVNISVNTLGHTAAYNDIILLKMTEKKGSSYYRSGDNKFADDVPEKKVIFIVHGLSVMGMSELPCLSTDKGFVRLLSYYLRHLKKFDIFLMPMANPDGYTRTEANFFWNKNTSPQDACLGVNLDRNFDVSWNTSRSVNSCSQQYPGPVPFSEAESKAIKSVFHKYSQRIHCYIHVHAGSYTGDIFKGDTVLYPKGYSEINTDDDRYSDLKGDIEETMRIGGFQVVTVNVDPLWMFYGKVSGTSVDYASSIYGIPYALEYVMQIYNEPPLLMGLQSSETLKYAATSEIWRRVIDATFINIWNSLKTTDPNA